MRLAFSGFFQDFSGYGEAARRVLSALWLIPELELELGNVLTDGQGQMPTTPEVERLYRQPITGHPDVHLIFASPTQFPELKRVGVRTIGLTCWETSKLHHTALEGLKCLDWVIVPSRHNQDVLQDTGGLPSSVVPFPILADPPVGELPLAISDDDYVFYAIGSWQERKNLMGVLVSYLTTFEETDNVHLVVKASGAVSPDAVLKYLRASINLPRLPRVSMVAERWKPEEVWALHWRANCYVSLARGEAFGIPALDAMQAGSQVISSGWGGQADILRWRIPIRFVNWRMTPVVQAYPYFSGDQLWADPDLCDAKSLMRSVYERRAPAQKYDLAEFAPVEVAKRLQRVLRDEH